MTEKKQYMRHSIHKNGMISFTDDYYFCVMKDDIVVINSIADYCKWCGFEALNPLYTIGLEEWNIPDSIMRLIQEKEQTVDDVTESLRQKHIDRLKDRKCSPKSGVIYLETLSNLERVADHAMNIASCAREESLHTHAI